MFTTQKRVRRPYSLLLNYNYHVKIQLFAKFKVISHLINFLKKYSGCETHRTIFLNLTVLFVVAPLKLHFIITLIAFQRLQSIYSLGYLAALNAHVT